MFYQNKILRLRNILMISQPMIPENTKNDLISSFAKLTTIEDYENLYTAIMKPTFYLKDLGVTARVLAHWKENDLIPTAQDFIGWSKLNFCEYIWVKVIQDLRLFGLPFQMIKKVKEYLFEKPDFIIDTRSFKEILKLKTEASTYNNLEEKERIRLNEMIHEPEFFEGFKNFWSNFKRIDMIVSCSIQFRKKVGILISKNGEISDWTALDQKSYESAYSKTELFISISDFIFEFMNDVTKEKFIVPLNILTKEELEVLRAIRRNDLTEVVIKFPLKSGRKKWKIQTKKNVGLPKEVQFAISQHLNLKNYQSINIKNDSGTLYCEKTHTKTL